jgi:hypothetical protein
MTSLELAFGTGVLITYRQKLQSKSTFMVQVRLHGPRRVRSVKTTLAQTKELAVR